MTLKLVSVIGSCIYVVQDIYVVSCFSKTIASNIRKLKPEIESKYQRNYLKYQRKLQITRLVFFLRDFLFSCHGNKTAIQDYIRAPLRSVYSGGISCIRGRYESVVVLAQVQVSGTS